MRSLFVAVSIAMVVCACKKTGASTSEQSDLSMLRSNAAFTCIHEATNLPPLNEDADKLFVYARYLQKQSEQQDFDDIMRYYRIAAAYGHYKANHNAQLLIE